MLPTFTAKLRDFTSFWPRLYRYSHIYIHIYMMLIVNTWIYSRVIRNIQKIT